MQSKQANFDHLHTHMRDYDKHPDCTRCRINAAAPEILEALKLAYKAIMEQTHIPISAMANAIAKAEGRE